MKRLGKFAIMLLTAWTLLFGMETVFDIQLTQISVEAHSGSVTDFMSCH